MNDRSLSDSKGSANDTLPGFIQSSTENHGGSNSTPGAFGSTLVASVAKLLAEEVSCHSPDERPVTRER